MNNVKQYTTEKLTQWADDSSDLSRDDVPPGLDSNGPPVGAVRDELHERCAAACNVPVFEDSYGDGVALVDGASIGTYRDLAIRCGLLPVTP